MFIAVWVRLLLLLVLLSSAVLLFLLFLVWRFFTESVQATTWRIFVRGCQPACCVSQVCVGVGTTRVLTSGSGTANVWAAIDLSKHPPAWCGWVEFTVTIAVPVAELRTVLGAESPRW